MKPSISIIIPAYNAEINIRRCLNSLLEQTEKNYEVVIVNDGSSDNTGKIAEEYKSNDCRFKVIHTHNRGVSNARNTGLDNAQGKYIIFLDSDDYLESNYLNMLMNTDDRYDIVCTNILMICEETGSELSRSNFRPSSFVLDSDESLENVITAGALEYAASKRYKKQIIDEYNIRFNEDFSVGEDTIFFVEYLVHSSTIKLTNESSYIYMKNNSGSSNQNFIFYQNIIKANNKICDILSTKYKTIHNSMLWKNRILLIYISLINYISNQKLISFSDKLSNVRAFLKDYPYTFNLSTNILPFNVRILYYLVKYKLVFAALMFMRLKKYCSTVSSLF